MLSAIPANEMAETLAVLAGANAGNAARHFCRHAFDAGDVATAILWTNIAALLGAAPAAAKAATAPVPQRMKDRMEATAFEGVRFEDVDGDTLIREALMDLFAAEKEASSTDVRPFPERLQPVAAYAADRAEALPLAA